MSNEEMRKKMVFIVEQQAQFAADIGVLREIQAADAKLLKEEITVLKELYRNLSDALTTVVGLVGTLAQTQTRTEERRNAFINVVERYIRGNGGSENPA
ncbi:MAG TPA: hypothetical protein VGJ66_16910 [Pyrinomonadaceae bacterium]|jgi:hypothetical protein